MNRHATAVKDEANCQLPHSLLSQMGQLVDRERVLRCENDQLRAQLVDMKQQEKKKYDALMVQYCQLTNTKQVTVKSEWNDEDVKEEMCDGAELVHASNHIHIKREYEDEQSDNGQAQQMDNKDAHTNAHKVTVNIKSEPMDYDLVVVKEEIKEEYEDVNDDDRCIVKRELLSDEEEQVDIEGTSTNTNQVTIKTEWNDELVKEEIKEKEDEDGHVDEKSSRPVKRPRMDHLSVHSTQPNNAQPKVESQPTAAAQANQANIQGEQIITLGLQCAELGCLQMFVPKEHYNMLDQLNDHLKYQHSIGLSRCLVKDCAQSFDSPHFLASHLNQDHANTTKWHCGKCSKHYATYKHLFVHNYQLHQYGHFQCSFPACTFTGEYKRKVHNHYRRQHKDKPDLVCRQSGCDYRTKAKAALKAHELAHIGIKSYRCKWSNCGLVNAQRNSVLSHIKTTHFGSKTSSTQDLTHLGKPADYIEMM